MRLAASGVMLIVGMLLLPVDASAQTTTYHLHQDLSSTAGLRALTASAPDNASVVLGQPVAGKVGEQGPFWTWDTAVGVPNQSGVIFQASSVTFTLWMRKTAKWGTMYPRAVVGVNYWSYGTPQPICSATGSSALTTTMAAYTFSCTSPVSITMAPSDRLVVSLYLWVTQDPRRKGVSVEVGLEGALNGKYDSRVGIPNAVQVPLQTNCPGADPNDALADDAALNACLDQGGAVILEPALQGSPGYIIAEGLVMNTSNTTLISGNSSNTRLKADPLLAAPMLRVVWTVSNYTISTLTFDGNRAQRSAWPDCDLGYQSRTHGYNLQLKGGSFLVEQVKSIGGLCGTALEVDQASTDYVIRNNVFGNNGFEEAENIPGGWSDGITLTTCKNAQVYGNQLTDNTDVDLIVGPTGGSYFCSVHENTISHINRYGFAWLMVAFNDREGANHARTDVYSNTVASNLNKLAFGVMVGEHPWSTLFSAANTGNIYSNASSGSVVPLAVDGVDAGQVSGNSATGAQGNNGFATCTYSANYTAADFGAANIQSGSYWRTYHGGACSQ